MFITALFIITRSWKKPRCPSADDWIRTLWYMYTMEYYSAIKRNTFESVLMRWMKLEPIIQSEISQKEKHPYMTTGKTIDLTRRTFVGKVMSLLLNMLSRLVTLYNRLQFHPPH